MIERGGRERKRREPNEFDSWGGGIRIGVVVEPPFVLDSDEVDVRWPGGRCFES